MAIHQLLGFIGGAAAAAFEATGGDATLTPGDGYKYHFYTTPGPAPFNVTGAPGDVDYIIIGGGGGGSGQPSGNNHGGGGAGAGGVRTGTLTATVQDYTFNVGTGGPVTADQYPGVVGNPSSALGITAQGGGSGGGYNQPTVEYNGGSGGGAPSYDRLANGQGDRVVGTNTPAPEQGNYGGVCDPSSSASAGGGGAGGSGGNVLPGTANIGGNGGIGIAFPGWTIPASYGTPGPNGSLRYFAGGGGGGGNGGGGSGGYGGGGAGSDSTNATPGTTNTGGGGGSTGGDGGLTGGSGGPGIIIIRYAV